MSEAPRCTRMVEVADVPCAHMLERLRRYCVDCPLRVAGDPGVAGQ